MSPGAKDGSFHVFMKKVRLLPLLIFPNGDARRLRISFQGVPFVRYERGIAGIG